MNIDKAHRNESNREIVRGIYPILNFTFKMDVEKVLDWAVRLPDVGIKLVQVRAKLFSDVALPMFLDEIVSQLRGAGLAVILNDYVELVGPTGADGVHLGADDFPVADARTVLGKNAIIGATCRTGEKAIIDIRQRATYVAAGSVFESSTKPGLPVIGIRGLKEIVDYLNHEKPSRHGWGRENNLPVCAIGGISLDNLGEVYRAGVSMVAVIGAIQDADDPVEAAGELVKEWEKLGIQDK
jgi:thiamine-phosphate pyrophosphorylase